MGDGRIALRARDPCDEELEFKFLERWWFEAVKFPVRRFGNGDVVLPCIYREWLRQVGEGGREWWRRYFDPEWVVDGGDENQGEDKEEDKGESDGDEEVEEGEVKEDEDREDDDGSLFGGEDDDGSLFGSP